MMKFIGIAWLLLCTKSFAYQVETSLEGIKLLSSHVEVATRSNDTNDITRLEFSKNQSNSISFSYTDKIIWLKTTLKNSEAQNIIFYIDSSLAGAVELFEKINGELVYLGKSGSDFKYSERTYPSTITAFELALRDNTTHEYYIKRSGIHRLDGRIFIADKKTFKQLESDKELIIFLYVGALLALFVYNLFIGIFTKSYVYYYYTGFLFFMGGVALNLVGGLDRIFYNTPPISDYLLMFSAGTVSFALLFTNRFLDATSNFPRFKYIYYFILSSGFIHFVLFPILKPYIGGRLGHTIDITLIVAVLSMFSIGFLSFIKGNNLARFYVISWGLLLVSATCWFGMTYKILPQNSLTKYALLWGNVLEMLVLSLGLAYRIVLLDREKKSAQLKAKEKERYHLLLRVVLHDIANPMTVLKSYHTLILKAFQNNLAPEKIRNYFEKSSPSIDVISDIIKSVRSQEVNYNQNNKSELTEIDLEEVINQSIIIQTENLENKNLSIKRAEKYFNVLGDRSLLINNIISNILTNAIKFSHRGDSIDIDCKKLANGKVEISIRDYGIGLSDEQINEFNAKGRLQSQIGTEGEKGTGYGMMLIKSYVELFHGKLIVSNAAIENDNPEQKGTVIKIQLNAPN